jgi:hypothetical protein
LLAGLAILVAVGRDHSNVNVDALINAIGIAARIGSSFSTTIL